MTNLIIANVETLSHDDGYSHSFSSDGHQFRGLAPWPPISGFCIRKTPEAVRTDCNRLMVLAGMNDVTPEKKDAAMWRVEEGPQIFR